MVIVVILILLIFGLLYFYGWMQNEAANEKMAINEIEFDTQKTVRQIISELRSVQCQIKKIEDDPLSDYDEEQKPAIAVAMVGNPTFSERIKTKGSADGVWGIQVIAYDMGNKRHVKMIALGERGLKAAFDENRVRINIKYSIDYRDRIAEMLA